MTARRWRCCSGRSLSTTRCWRPATPLSRALLRLGRTDDARAEMLTFERLQREAMEAERRRFEDNARAIEEALRK